MKAFKVNIDGPIVIASTISKALELFKAKYPDVPASSIGVVEEEIIADLTEQNTRQMPDSVNIDFKNGQWHMNGKDVMSGNQERNLKVIQKAFLIRNKIDIWAREDENGNLCVPEVNFPRLVESILRTKRIVEIDHDKE